MTRPCPLPLITIAIFAGLLFLQPAYAAPSTVARPQLPGINAGSSPSTAFFIKTGAADEVAAVSTAHAWKISELAQAGRVNFLLGDSSALLSTSTALLVPPGRPFNAPGGTLAGDFFLFALAGAPSASEALELEGDSGLARHQPGDEIWVHGIPSTGGRNEVRLAGRISEINTERIQLVLDDSITLRGWGGAPVISKKTGHVIGIVQAIAKTGEASTLVAGPISALRDSLRALNTHHPVDRKAGEGRFSLSDLTKTPTAAVLPPLETTTVHLEVEFPADGALIANSACGVFVAGRATPGRDKSKRFDVAFVLDTSGSTAESTGADINGNGIIGTGPQRQAASLLGEDTDKGDSILAAEVAAARQILRNLDPTTTRVAILTFAGGDTVESAGFPARTRQPLTHEYALAAKALDAVLRRNPQGGTHISGAVDHAVTELLGFVGSRSIKDPGSEKLIFFFTDGYPTRPFGSLAPSANIRSVRGAARRASMAQVRIHSFSIGPEALASPIASVELADFTGGAFIPVRHPGDLQSVVDVISFSNLEDVKLRNATTGIRAYPFRISLDGSWGGFLQIVQGENLVEISAVSADGIQAIETLRFFHELDAPKTSIPKNLAVRHNRLLEDCLRDIKHQRVAAEEEHAEKIRGELLLEIERERTKARRRAAQQRRELRLEVEE